MPASLTVVDPLNLVSSAMRSKEKAVSAVTSALRHVEVLVLAVVTSMARYDSGAVLPGGGRQAGSRGKPTSAGRRPWFDADVRRLVGSRRMA